MAARSAARARAAPGDARCASDAGALRPCPRPSVRPRPAPKFQLTRQLTRSCTPSRRRGARRRRWVDTGRRARRHARRRRRPAPRVFAAPALTARARSVAVWRRRATWPSCWRSSRFRPTTGAPLARARALPTLRVRAALTSRPTCRSRRRSRARQRRWRWREEAARGGPAGRRREEAAARGGGDAATLVCQYFNKCIFSGAR